MKKVDEKIGICFIVFVTFIMSQDFAWKIMMNLIKDEHWNNITFACLQMIGAYTYLLLTIYFTKDKLWIQKILNRPTINKLIRSILSISITISIWIKSMLLFLPDLFQIPRVDWSKNVDEAKREIYDYKSKPLIVQAIFSGAFGIAIMTVIVAIVDSTTIFEMVKLISNFIMDLMAFIIVCLNILNSQNRS